MVRSLPKLTDEELSRSPVSAEGFGALRTEQGFLPLWALDVRAHLEGLVAGMEVTQTFYNSHTEPLEATYIFPLPDRAALTGFRFEAGGRVIEGELRERGEARTAYQQAVRAGHRAALSEEERPGVFTMKVGNLPPGESATVRLTLAGPLPYSDGEATFRFPLVVAPRYIPGKQLQGPPLGSGTSPDSDVVPDASRISPPVMLAGFPNAVRLSLSVEVPAFPLAPYDFRSSLHTMVEDEGGRARVFRLQSGEHLDHDFILRFRLAEGRVKTALSLAPDANGEGGTFLLTVVPPTSPGYEARPRDVVFVLDRSGSMAGWKMVAARRALARMVDTLTEMDRFALLAFDNTVQTVPGCSNSLEPATDRNRFRAVEFLAKVEARGGTQMAEPLLGAVKELEARRAQERESIVVLLTDGQVGNEDQILRELRKRARQVRIFALGIDRAVNAAFLEHLAAVGTGGGCELVESEERLDEVMESIHRRIGTPVLTGLRVEPAGLDVVPWSVTPSRLPNLFTGAPLLVLGRYSGMSEGGLALHARESGGAAWLERVEGRACGSVALAALWARSRLRELEDRYVTSWGERGALEKEIVHTSLRFGALCRFTAYVAVDRSERINPNGNVLSVVQPVQLPDGWAMPNQTYMGSVPSAASVAGFASAPEPAAFCLRDAPTNSALPKCTTDSDELSVSKRKPGQGYGGAVDSYLATWVGVKRKKERRRKPEIDRSPFRQRVVELQQELQAASHGDLTSRWAVLMGMINRLETLCCELTFSGEKEPCVQQLAEVVITIRAFRPSTLPISVIVLDLWNRVEGALRDWLALVPLPTQTNRGESFWK
jgi:Ca-activated chloride channel family protein